MSIHTSSVGKSNRAWVFWGLVRECALALFEGHRTHTQHVCFYPYVLGKRRVSLLNKLISI